MAYDPYKEFWEHVHRHLRERFDLSEPGARKAAEQYRQRLRQHDALEAVYHSMPGEIAESIAGQGYLQDRQKG